MFERLSNFLAPAGFEPRGHGFLWEQSLLWLYVASDSIVALSYYIIGIALVSFVRKRGDLPFNWMFLIFGAFIFACGTTHLMGVWTLWKPVFWLDGSIKAVTAALSFTTAIMLWPLIPKALALASASQSPEVNHGLQKQIAQHDLSTEHLRQSEERFRLLVEGIQEYAIYMLDPKGFVTTWTRGAERIKGYREEEIIGKHFSCFYPMNDVQAGKPNRALELAAAQGRYAEESLRVRKDGSVFWASVVVTALYDSAGRLHGFAKVVRDITDRKETEERLRENDRLATLGTTAAVFAHEIANPLNGLSTSLQVVTELLKSSENHDPLVAETIDIAHQEIQRLSSLLRDYRSLARPYTLNVQPTNLRQIVEEVLAPAAKDYTASGILVKLDFNDNLPLVPLDQEKMKQVILNVCKNAVEAMPQGGTLICKGYRLDDRIVLEISDTGVGIPENIDVFQLFKTTKPYGTGLGLPIVEQIISEHHGTIHYVSEIDKGTTFSISLPI